jgi:hypothetical protein
MIVLSIFMYFFFLKKFLKIVKKKIQVHIFLLLLFKCLVHNPYSILVVYFYFFILFLLHSFFLKKTPKITQCKIFAPFFFRCKNYLYNTPIFFQNNAQCFFKTPIFTLHSVLCRCNF